MFGSILLSVVTLVHVYVFWRSWSVPLINRHFSRTLYAGAGLILWTIFFLGRVIGHQGTGPAARSLEFAGMTWMAVLFLIFVCLIIAEIITVFGFLMRRQAPAIRGAALFIAGCLSIIALVQGLRPPVVQNYEVNLSGLPRDLDGTVLVAMSDLHIGSQLGRKWLENRVAQVKKQGPDLVLLLGDNFEGHGISRDELLPVLRGLSAPLGVFVAPGNHESHRSGNISLSLIESAGFQLLLNRWVEIRSGLIISGIEDLTANHRRGRNNDPISTALANRPSGATILISHTPLQFERAAVEGVGLMLSGHTHGGQIWPFDYLVRLTYPFLEGMYEFDGMIAIVSRGTGTWGPRMRLWSPGEILRITLHSKD